MEAARMTKPISIVQIILLFIGLHVIIIPSVIRACGTPDEPAPEDSHYCSDDHCYLCKNNEDCKWMNITTDSDNWSAPQWSCKKQTGNSK